MANRKKGVTSKAPKYGGMDIRQMILEAEKESDLTNQQTDDSEGTDAKNELFKGFWVG